MLCHTYGIYNVITFLSICIGRNLTELIITDHTAASSLHLCIQHIRMHILHEKNNFQRSYICSGRHQCNRNSYSEILLCSHVSDKRIGISRGVCDLLYKMLRNLFVIEFILKNISYTFHDLGSMIIILGKNKCLRHILPAFLTLRVQLFIYRLLICHKNFSDLIFIYYRAAKLFIVILHFF